MFQDFSDPTGATETASRLARVRAGMAKRGLDAFLVPRADRHQGEYVPPSAERLRWLTGFSGSAGLAVVGRDKAALFVDGRYTVQVRHEADHALFEVLQVPENKVSDWLGRALGASATIGFDPWLHTVAWCEELTRTLKQQSIRLKPVANLVDLAWGRDRPPEPTAPVTIQPVKYAGTSVADKLAALQKRLAEDRQDAVVLTLPDSICWLFNIRGGDVAHNPVTLAFAIVPARGKAELFIDEAKLGDGKRGEEVRRYLAAVAEVAPPAMLTSRLKHLAAASERVRLDADTAAVAIARALGAKMVRGADPCRDPKARKCAAEIKGARAAHLRDGVAMTRFLYWLTTQPAGKVDEIGAVRQLEQFRRASPLLRDLSFPTISGSGPNGAIVHYRVTEATNRHLRAGELFLVDSGAQYADGTTDITRTIAIGPPTEEMRQRYTAVLRGHIAISTARFPAGTRGIEIDAMARRPLWELGLDYDHGTGHGVGSYLSVHEGPAGISKRSMVALEPGMILSNEPGYYKADAYGIRIENLVLVCPPRLPPAGERPMLAFETLTLAPYDRRLIRPQALTAAEREWIDAYHARVDAAIGGELEAAADRPARAWLASATAPLDR